MKRIIFLIIAALFFASPALAERIIKGGATSKCYRVFVSDSSSTTGAGLTGLAHDSASLTCYYQREGESSATSITLASSTLGTYTSGAFKEISSSNMPGFYEFCPPNAAIAAGVSEVAILCKGATNMAPMALVILLSPTVNLGSTDTASIAEAAFAATGTFQSGSTTTSLVLNGSETANRLVGQGICITSGSGAKQCALITAYDTSTKTATVTPTLTTAPANGDSYSLRGSLYTVANSLATQAKADVNAEMVDTLTTDTYSELSSCPAFPMSITTMLRYVTEYFKFKLTSSSELQQLFKDNGSDVLCEADLSDEDDVFTRTEHIAP